jgi:hypothetical protein
VQRSCNCFYLSGYLNCTAQASLSYNGKITTIPYIPFYDCSWCTLSCTGHEDGGAFQLHAQRCVHTEAPFNTPPNLGSRSRIQRWAMKSRLSVQVHHLARHQESRATTSSSDSKHVPVVHCTTRIHDLETGSLASVPIHLSFSFRTRLGPSLAASRRCVPASPARRIPRARRPARPPRIEVHLES